MTQKVPAQKTSARKPAKKLSKAHAKAKPKREYALAYDLGGTKVAAGVVDSKGKVITEVREPVVLEHGKQAVFEQLARLGKALLAQYPSIKRAGIASAGPLDPMGGVLLDPTNFASTAGTWGNVPLASILSRKLRIPAVLENDAAAAMLAEHWIGAAKGYKNAMILTLGTGLGTGIISNGELVRAGHYFHPEAGHIILKMGDESAPCGCGNLGCAEAFLSGRNFARRARTRFGNPSLTGKDLTELALKRDPRALAAFEEYAHLMAIAIHNFVVLYCPEIVVFTGSFAESAPLFMEQTRRHLEQLLARRRVGTDLLPKLAVSSLDNQAGIIGGAYVAFNR
jgi:glucokinase